MEERWTVQESREFQVIGCIFEKLDHLTEPSGVELLCSNWKLG